MELVSHIGLEKTVLQNGSRLVFVCGNGLVRTDLGSKEQEVFPTDGRRGISALCKGPDGLVAYSCRAKRPEIVVLDDSLQTAVATFRGGVELEYGCLDISSCKTRLLGIGAELQRELVVWDFSSQSVLSRIALKFPCTQANFAPESSDWICCSGLDKFQIWHLTETFRGLKLQLVRSVDVPSPAMHGFSPAGEAILISKESLTYFDCETGSVSKHEGNVHGINVIAAHLYAGCSDGTLRKLGEEDTFCIESGLGNVSNILVYDDNDNKCIAFDGLGNQALIDFFTRKVELLNQSHAGEIVALVRVFTMNEGQYFASFGQDSQVKVWNSANFESIPVVQGGLADLIPTSADSSPLTPLIPFGTEDGYIQLIQISEARGVEFYRSRIKACNGEVSKVSFSPRTDAAIFAASSQHDDVVSIFLIDFRGATLQKVIEMSGNLVHGMLWRDGESLILVGRDDEEQNLDLFLNDSNSGCIENSSKESLGGLLLMPSTNTLLLTFSNTQHSIEVFDIHTFEHLNSLKTGSHEGNPWSLGAINRNGAFISGAMDGSVVLWDENHENICSLMLCSSMITSIVHLAETNLIALGHFNGSLTIVKTDQDEREDFCVTDSCKVSLFEEESEAEESNPKTINMTEYEKRKKATNDALEEERETLRVERKTKINSLRDRLNALLENNEKVPELEKLDRDEFTIDTERQQALVAANEKTAAEKREAIGKEIRMDQESFSRIKDACWDSMEIHLKEIHGFQSKTRIVRNFPIARQSKEEIKELEQVRRMRFIELKSSTAHTGIAKRIPEPTDWIVNAESDEIFLYNPLKLRSEAQIRTQILLVEDLQRKLMIEFNKHFEKAREDKEDTIERKTGRYTRINEILLELQREKLRVPKFRDPAEDEEFVFTITQDEIGVEKYLSKTERERIAKQEEERLRRERESAKNNMGERALQDMMQGTLQAVREPSLAERTMEMPQWMQEMDYASMADDQRKEFDEFQIEIQKFTEEKEKYIKSLESEMKKVQQDIDELVESFDAGLESLQDLKVDYLERITVQSVYIAQLRLDLLQRQERARRQKEIRKELEELKEKQSVALQEINENQATMDAADADLKAAENQDKALEKQFKQKIQEHSEILDPETLKVIMTLYKQRTAQEFRHEIDVPPGTAIDGSLWEIIQSSRRKKIESESVLEEVLKSHRHTAGLFSALLEEKQVCDDRIKSLNNESQSIDAEKVRTLQNPKILVKLKQGQDEIPNTSNDYERSLLIHRGVVEKENTEIMKLGENKVGIMKKIKDFRKSINFMQWEHRYLLQQEYDLGETFTDLHMLRVTKELREILDVESQESKSGRDESTGEQKDAEKLKKLQEKKIEKLEGGLQKVKQKQIALDKENNELQGRIEEMRMSVQMRDAVLQARTGRSSTAAGSGASAAKARMKAVVTKRKFMDLAKAQTDEIQNLKIELDNLRDRNYPRF